MVLYYRYRALFRKPLCVGADGEYGARRHHADRRGGVSDWLGLPRHVRRGPVTFLDKYIRQPETALSPDSSGVGEASQNGRKRDGSHSGGNLIDGWCSDRKFDPDVRASRNGYLLRPE